MARNTNGPVRIGFYVCHCRHNIAGVTENPKAGRSVARIGLAHCAPRVGAIAG